MTSAAKVRPQASLAVLRSMGFALLLGVVQAAGQAPAGLWWLSLPALCLGIAVVTGAGSGGAGVPDGPRRRCAAAAWTAWAFGTGYFGAALFWIVEPFQVEADRYGWMAPFALLLLAGGLALFWGAAGWLAVRLTVPSVRFATVRVQVPVQHASDPDPMRPFSTTVPGPLGAPVSAEPGRWPGVSFGSGAPAMAFAMALSGAEVLRGHVLTGFPWAMIGHVWIGTPVMQAAAIGGAGALTLTASLLAVLPLIAGWRTSLPAAALALALVWGGGAIRLAQPDPVPAHAVTVRLVQPNATQALKWRADMQQVFLDRQLAYSAVDPRPDMIVWPETAVPYLLDQSGALLEVIAAQARGSTVALGIQRAEGPRYYNSLAVLDPAGKPVQVYDKVHLVPFGEYTPLGDLMAGIGVRAFAARFGAGYSAGTAFRVLDLGPLGRVLPLICYEAVFAQDLRAAQTPAQGGRADWVLQVTNDGWFGALTGPYQHLAQARLRAVEQGLPLLRAANTGISAVIDARGQVLASLPLNTEGYLDTVLPGALPIPLYARTGDWPVGLVIIVSLLALLIRRRTVSG